MLPRYYEKKKKKKRKKGFKKDLPNLSACSSMLLNNIEIFLKNRKQFFLLTVLGDSISQCNTCAGVYSNAITKTSFNYKHFRDFPEIS